MDLHRIDARNHRPNDGLLAFARAGRLELALDDRDRDRAREQRSDTPFVARRDATAKLGPCDGKAILEHAHLPATIISYDEDEDPGAAHQLLADVATYFRTPGRMPGVLVCRNHVRLVVGALDAPYPPHLILLDPNWLTPKYEPRDQEWLEGQDTEFELMLPVAME